MKKMFAGAIAVCYNDNGTTRMKSIPYTGWFYSESEAAGRGYTYMQEHYPDNMGLFVHVMEITADAMTPPED